MDTALPQKFPFILDRNLAKANCTENRVCTSCDTVVLALIINYKQISTRHNFFHLWVECTSRYIRWELEQLGVFHMDKMYNLLVCYKSDINQKIHYFSGGAFESLISSQLLKKEIYLIISSSKQCMESCKPISLYLHNNFWAFGWCK